MSTYIRLIVEVDDEYADPDHPMGVSNEGYEALVDVVNTVGIITDGPARCDENGVPL